MRGRFITIEGGDGAGKSTQLQTIQDWLAQHQIDAVFTREPGGTSLGESLRALLLGEGGHAMGADAELLMMFAARAQHIESVIQPNLDAGKWVVSDRFTDASFAYQGARQMTAERIAALEQWVQGSLRPDLTLLFDVPVEVGLKRVLGRGAEDRFEQESLAYKQAVRDIYLARAEAEPDRIVVIDADRPLASVKAGVINALEQALEEEDP